MGEPLETVVEERFFDHLLEAPTRLGIAHREHEPVAAAAEVKARLGLDRHRQVRREACDRLGLEQLAAERSNRELESELLSDLSRPWPGRDHEHVGGELRRIFAFTDLHPARRSSADELARYRWRVCDPVLPADDGARHVVGAHAGRNRSRDYGHSQGTLELGTFLELGETDIGRREEEVTDLVEEWRAELLEEADARLGEAHLRFG